MKLSEWRAKRDQGEEATLPSGLEVRLRKVSVLDLAQRGGIPATLRPKVSEYISKPPTAPTLDDLDDFSEVVDLVVAACLVEPAELVSAELPWGDRLAIYLWANEASGRLEPFRGEAGESVGLAFTSGKLRAEAKRNPRARS